MRNTYIVTYDIADPKRLKKVCKTCQGVGEHLQLSVFECDLSKSELIDLKQRLNEIIHNDHDQVLFIDLGPAEARGDRAISSIGIPYIQFDAPCRVY